TPGQHHSNHAVTNHRALHASCHRSGLLVVVGAEFLNSLTYNHDARTGLRFVRREHVSQDSAHHREEQNNDAEPEQAGVVLARVHLEHHALTTRRAATVRSTPASLTSPPGFACTSNPTSNR